MEPLLTDLISFKNGSRANLVVDSWTRQNGPSRSPDLNPCDFFLWGYLKKRVLNPIPKTLEDLKENITREMKKIPKEILKSSFLNFVKRCNFVLSAEGIEY